MLFAIHANAPTVPIVEVGRDPQTRVDVIADVKLQRADRGFRSAITLSGIIGGQEIVVRRKQPESTVRFHDQPGDTPGISQLGFEGPSVPASVDESGVVVLSRRRSVGSNTTSPSEKAYVRITAFDATGVGKYARGVRSWAAQRTGTTQATAARNDVASIPSFGVGGPEGRNCTVDYFCAQWNVSENAGPYCVTAYCRSLTAALPLLGTLPVSMRSTL
jgi:hypothetical protein